MIPPNKTHGMAGTPIYKVWSEMKRRCNNPNATGYYKYGARGIKVCKRWADFNNFYKDMGDRPTAKHSLERLNNDGDYSPENVIWSTSNIQARNRRDTQYIELYIDGKFTKLSMPDVAEYVGIPARVIRKRLGRGWKISEAITIPLGEHVSKQRFSKQSILKCKVDGCNKTYRAKGFCMTHYLQMSRYGATHFGDKRTSKIR